MSEKMHRAVRKLQNRIVSPNQPYQNLSSDKVALRSESSLRRRNSLSRSGRSSSSDLESDDESPDSPPSDVPEGFLAVYVGRERQRFVISAEFLKNEVFKLLLEKSAEELGFEHKGGLPIACEAAFFEHLLWLMETKDPGLRNLEINCGFSAYS